MPAQRRLAPVMPVRYACTRSPCLCWLAIGPGANSSIFAFVRKPLVIAVVSAVLLVQPGFRELLKVPALFVHYAEHLSADPDLEFLAFLHDHYCPEHRHCHGTGGQHHALPFQSMDAGQVKFTVALQTEEQEGLWQPLSSTRGKAEQSTRLFTEPGRDIWQPPKI